MVETRELMQILFAIENTAEAMMQITGNNPAIARLPEGERRQLAVFAPDDEGMKICHRGQFIAFETTSSELAGVTTSMVWPCGTRQRHGFASINSTGTKGPRA